MIKKLLIFIFVFISLTLVFSSENIDAPFVSKIYYEVANGKVMITWKNPAEFDGYISIYRSNSVIDSTNKISRAKKISFLRKKESKFIDSPGEYGYYYYAVIITNRRTNEDNLVLVPYRNYTLKPAEISKEDLFLIRTFSAESKRNYITLRWEYRTESGSTTKVMLYRNTAPIKNINSLYKSIKIATLDIGTKLYIDTPVSNIDYYYAIFVEGEAVKTFVPKINITIDPVSIIDTNEAFPDFSIDNFIPLPLLAIKNDPKSGKYFVDPQILKNPKKYKYNFKVKKTINDQRVEFNDIFSDLMKEKQAKLQKLDFHILYNEDIFFPKEYKVEYNTALDHIENNKYTEAKAIFEELIKEILPDDMLERVGFYLGLIYYSQGDYYMSYIHLILSYDTYRREVFPYLESIYQNVFAKLER